MFRVSGTDKTIFQQEVLWKISSKTNSKFDLIYETFTLQYIVILHSRRESAIYKIAKKSCTARPNSEKPPPRSERGKRSRNQAVEQTAVNTVKRKRRAGERKASERNIPKAPLETASRGSYSGIRQHHPVPVRSSRPRGRIIEELNPAPLARATYPARTRKFRGTIPVAGCTCTGQ